MRVDFATAADIRFGPGRLAEVPPEIVGWGVTRVLLVTGSRPARAGGLRAALADAGVASTTFAVPGEPTIDLLRQAVAEVASAGCQGVVGYGGGSALDVAKAVSALASSGSDPLDHLEVVGGGRPLTRPALPCVAVPTTAGTGSEVTRNAVVTAGQVKASLRSRFLLPRLAVVDPDLLVGLPTPIVAYSGMDALSQLIEPFLSGRATPLTDALAREGLPRSARSLGRAGRQGLDGDPALREDLAMASLLGGLCLANSGLGAVHGFAAAAGARLSAPHGALCAALLPAAMEVNLRALRERAPGHPAATRFAELARLLLGRADATPEQAIAWLGALREALAIPGLAQYGVDATVVRDLVAAARRSNSMRANPIELTDDELRLVLTRSL